MSPLIEKVNKRSVPKNLIYCIQHTFCLSPSNRKFNNTWDIYWRKILTIASNFTYSFYGVSSAIYLIRSMSCTLLNKYWKIIRFPLCLYFYISIIFECNYWRNITLWQLGRFERQIWRDGGAYSGNGCAYFLASINLINLRAFSAPH